MPLARVIAAVSECKVFPCRLQSVWSVLHEASSIREPLLLLCVVLCCGAQCIYIHILSWGHRVSPEVRVGSISTSGVVACQINVAVSTPLLSCAALCGCSICFVAFEVSGLL